MLKEGDLVVVTCDHPPGNVEDHIKGELGVISEVSYQEDKRLLCVQNEFGRCNYTEEDLRYATNDEIHAKLIDFFNPETLSFYNNEGGHYPMAVYLITEVKKVSENKEAKYSSKWVIEETHTTDVFIDIGKDPKELCKKLKDLGFIDSADMRKVSVSSMDKDIIEVRSKKSLKPLCRLDVARWRFS